MKKAIKLTIAITLCFAMLFQSIGFAIATTVSTDLVWTVYSGGKIGTGGNVKSDASVEVVTDTIYAEADGDGDGQAFKLSANCYAQYVTCKLPVEANKYYDFSFNYYAGQLDSYGGVFSHVSISKDGAVIENYNPDYLAKVYRDFAYYTNKNNAMVATGLRTISGVTTGWNKMTVSFYSGNTTEIVFAVRPTVSTSIPTYIDNLKLSETTELAGANDMLSDATGVVYNMSSLTSFAETNKFPISTYTFAKNTTNYTAETDADGDGQVYTMSANCHAQYATMQIPVVKNQNYELKFKYHSNKIGSSNAMFSDIRVIEYGAANSYESAGNLAAINRDKKTGYLRNKNGVMVNTNINITEGTSTEKWNELTINFYSRNLTRVMLVLRPVLDGATELSIDDVSLTAVDSFTGSERMVSDITIYDYETNLLGKGGTVRKPEYGSSYSFVNDNLYTEADGDNDGEAYCFTGCSAQWPTAKLALKAKTHYNLTFKYKTDALDGVKGAFSDVIVLADGKSKNVVTDHLGFIGRDDAYYNNKNGTKIEFANRVNSNVKANEWNTMTVSFYSGDLTEALIAIRPTVATVYVDNIKLTEATLPSSNLYPSGWTVYQMGNANNATDGVWEHNTAVISESTEIVHSTDIDGKSIVLGSGTYAQYPTLPLKVEKNKYYTLKFYYYSNKVNTGDNNKVFSDIYVATPGITSLKNSAIAHATTAADGTVYKNGEPITVAGFTAKGATAGAWNEVKVSFYSGNNDSVRLAVRPAVNDSTTVYLDDITLNNISVSTSYNQKAAIRTADNTDSENIKANGLRIYNAIQADWLSDTEGNIVEYGAIAIRQGYMEKKFADKTAPDMDMLSLAGQGVGIGVAYRAEGVTTITGSRMMNIHWEKDNADDIFNKHIFTTYLTGIAEANYGEEYLVRSYAIDANGKIYYGETSSISIFKVAQAISNANNAENTYDNEAFKSFVIDSGLSNTYAQWCADNSLEVGGLYTSLTTME